MFPNGNIGAKNSNFNEDVPAGELLRESTMKKSTRADTSVPKSGTLWQNVRAREHNALPPRVNFRHLYISSDRGPGARDAAAAALAKIAGKAATAEAFLMTARVKGARLVLGPRAVQAVVTQRS